MPGVGQVLNFGAADYSMRIWVKPDQLAKLGLTVADLTQAIQRQNTVNPSGQLGAEPAPAGQEFTYTVRALGTLVTPEQFGQVVVRLNPDGSVVRLRDVARIELGALNYKQIARLNGKPSSIIAIYQLPGSNALSVVKGVKEEMEQLKQRFPNDLDYLVSLDTTVVITEGIREILTTLLEAIGLVLLVVFIFLQNWRATLIPLIAVPVSLIGTFAVFPLLGFSINTLSLFGLVLAIGLVVDDAIVVVEAVEHNIEEGMAPRDATIRAMEMVQGPVVAIALILASVFLPVALMSGIQGRLNKQFAVTIAISVLISAFNALSLSPALSAMLLKPRPKGEKRRGLLARFFGGFNRVFGKATDRYITASRFLIRKFALGLGILAAFAVLAFFLGRSVPGSFLPDEDQGYFFLNLQLPDASSLQRTDAACRKARRDPRQDAGRRLLHDDRRLQPALLRLGVLLRLLLRRAEALGAARRLRADGAGADRQDQSGGQGADPRGHGRLRLPAARHPGARRGGRLLAVAAGPQRRLARLPVPEPADVPGGGAQAARSCRTSTPCSAPACRRCSSTSTATRSSSRECRSATSTRRCRRSWAPST